MYYIYNMLYIIYIQKMTVFFIIADKSNRNLSKINYKGTRTKSDVVLESLLPTLNIFHSLFLCFYC